MDPLQKLAQYFAKLPNDYRRALGQSNWLARAEQVFNAHQLTPAEKHDALLEAALVLCGLDTRSNFAAQLATILGERGAVIARDIDAALFAPFSAELDKLAAEPVGTVGEEKFNRLPQALQDILASDNTEDKITAIGTRHRLHIDQIGALNEVVERAVLGEISTQNLTPALVSEVRIDQATAQTIASEVGQEIFAPIREALKEATPAAPSVFEQKMSGTFTAVDPYRESPK